MTDNPLELSINLSLSGICNRGCKHCLADAGMRGNLLAIEKASLVVERIKELREYYKEAFPDIRIYFCFTGKGEPLLNPDMPEIVDMLLAMPGAQGEIVTSGMEPDDAEERSRFMRLLSMPHVEKLDFTLSFSLFQKGFPKRLLATARTLIENGKKSIGIKVSLPKRQRLDKNGIPMTFSILEKTLHDYFKSIRRQRISTHFNDESVFERKLLAAEAFRLFDRHFSLKMLPHQSLARSIDILNCELMSFFDESVRIESCHGNLSLALFPQLVARMGRAKNLDGSMTETNDRICGYLSEDWNHLHISPDGSCYPSCECPYSEGLELGNLANKSLVEIIRKRQLMMSCLLRCMLLNRSMSGNICDICAMVAERIRPKLSSIGL